MQCSLLYISYSPLILIEYLFRFLTNSYMGSQSTIYSQVKVATLSSNWSHYRDTKKYSPLHS